MLPALIFKYLQAHLSIKERCFHQISNPQETPLTCELIRYCLASFPKTLHSYLNPNHCPI